MELDVIILLVLLGTAFFLGITVYPLWFVLHKILSKRLDSILFKEPYFKRSELSNYLVFPLSSLKSLAYIYLIAIPAWAKKKRFKGFSDPLPVSTPIIVACKIQFSLMLFGLVFAVVFFSFIVWSNLTM